MCVCGLKKKEQESACALMIFMSDKLVCMSFMFDLFFLGGLVTIMALFGFCYQLALFCYV